MTKTLDTINGKQECIDSAYGFKGFSPQSLALIDSGPVVGQSTMEGGGTYARGLLHSIAEKKQRGRLGWRTRHNFWEYYGLLARMLNLLQQGISPNSPTAF